MCDGMHIRREDLGRGVGWGVCLDSGGAMYMHAILTRIIKQSLIEGANMQKALRLSRA